MPQGDEKAQGKVVCRVKDNMGHLKGRCHPNPQVDTFEYRDEFPDCSSEEYAANLIAEKCFTQVDNEGCKHLLLDEIAMYRTNDAALTVENCYLGSN